MASIIVQVSDPHWTDRRPSSRKDDYLATQIRKTEDVIRLAREIKRHTAAGASAITIAGDLFHQPKGKLIDRKLDNLLLSILRKSPCPILTIPGNHDKDYDRTASLESHPYNILVEAGVIADVSYPRYRVVGDDPPVIVTGYPYTMEGPTKWLQILASTRALYDIKKEVFEKYGKTPSVMAMTHCHWSDRDGDVEGSKAYGTHWLLGTGIDVNHFGDPHRFDGTIVLQDGDRRISLVGPGALFRGTLAEHDTARVPTVGVTSFLPDNTYEVIYVAIPHEPAERVFDLEAHHRKIKTKKINSIFSETLQHLLAQKVDLDRLLSDSGAEQRVLLMTREYLDRASQALSDKDSLV